MVAEILGTGDDVAQLLRRSMAEADIEDDSSVLLFAVGSSKPEANAAVFDLAARLAAAVVARFAAASAPARQASPMWSAACPSRSR